MTGCIDVSVVEKTPSVAVEVAAISISAADKSPRAVAQVDASTIVAEVTCCSVGVSIAPRVVQAEIGSRPVITSIAQMNAGIVVSERLVDVRVAFSVREVIAQQVFVEDDLPVMPLGLPGLLFRTGQYTDPDLLEPWINDGS